MDGFTKESVRFGEDLAALGDVDGDGICDLAISDPLDRDGGDWRGAVWIAFLERTGRVRSAQKISDWYGNFEGTLLDNADFGQALGVPGDLDGDGVPDLLVGGGDGLWVLFLKRHGAVRAYREFRRGPRTALDDHGDFGRSIACTRSLAAEGVTVVVSGGLQTVWMLTLAEDGGIVTR